MLEKLKTGLSLALHAVTTWADPWWWVCISALIFALCLVHPVPLRLPDVEVHSFKKHVALWTRWAVVGLSVALGFVIPLLTFFLFGALSGRPQREAADMFYSWVGEMASAYWTAPLAALLGGVLISFTWLRYADPFLSSFFRRWRVKQKEDERSDVKSEAGLLKTKNYDPRRYYKAGSYFIGLDEHNQPLYIPDAQMHETMHLYLGPTGTGKGSIFGVVIDQAVDKGVCVFFVDPKEDDFVPYIMYAAAKRNGRPFVYLDLNPEGQGHWHPFKGGSLRDRRARVLAAFKLGDTGSNADVYKRAERAQLDRALEKTDGSVKQMLDHVRGEDGDDEKLSSLRDSLSEWSRISTFTPPKKNRGHSVEQSLRNTAVVYVRGSTSDNVVRLASRVYVAEVLQEIKRLKAERTSHAMVVTDEIRFTMGNELVDGVATIRSAKANIIAATQGMSDLQNIVDQDIDKKAAQQSFMINCKIKLLYMAGDTETAKWGEENSGTTVKRLAAMERTEVNRYGGETWDEGRTLKDEEVPYVSQNRLLMLPERVGVLYRPGVTATTVFTAYVPTDKSVERPWEKAKPAEKPGDHDDNDTAQVEATTPPAEEAPRGIDVSKL
ncbi:conjugal transfer protein TraC [Eleftheria terrae]|uniref:conjugal transfer protein TraC n=1 Tax=Eleftheria terrae TaxID=1597781 RepID=UPI00263B0377|nr:conjugal transfer protein TraC [Eleftheria terrae]